MIILGIDTSGRDGSVALARGDGECFEVLGCHADCRRNLLCAAHSGDCGIAGGCVSGQEVRLICWPSPPVPDLLPGYESAYPQ